MCVCVCVFSPGGASKLCFDGLALFYQSETTNYDFLLPLFYLFFHLFSLSLPNGLPLSTNRRASTYSFSLNPSSPSPIPSPSPSSLLPCEPLETLSIFSLLGRSDEIDDMSLFFGASLSVEVSCVRGGKNWRQTGL